MKRIPNYALYGESALPVWCDLLHLEWITERSRPNRWEIKPHQHDALLQIVYIRSGEGEISIENRRIAFTAPCIILLPCRTVHAFRCTEETDGPIITAAQRPLESMARIASPDVFGLIQQPAVIPLPWPADGQEPFWPLFQLLQQEAQNMARGHVAAGLSLLIALLVQISRLDRQSTARRPGKGRRAALLGQFRELVNQHFRSHWTLDLYAEKLGISPAQLGRICREELGEAPMALVGGRVMREAQRQLAYTDLEIKQIAHGLGFSDSSYFSRYFRKQAGITPREFRDAFQSAEGAVVAVPREDRLVSR